MRKQILIKISFFLILLGVTIIVLYKLNRPSQDDKGEDSVIPEKQNGSIQDILPENLNKYFWFTDYDTVDNKEFIKKGSLMDSAGHSPSEWIEILNRRNSEAKIEMVDLKNDTIIIKIRNDVYLTERMGSTGAHCFLAETVYTLTEEDAIIYVRIQMNPGSHASPGIYSRQSFHDMVKE